MIALAWIRARHQRWKQFVANRITEIQSLTSPSSWSHVSSADSNADYPADLTTRKPSAEVLVSSCLWRSPPTLHVTSRVRRDATKEDKVLSSVLDSLKGEEVDAKGNRELQFHLDQRQFLLAENGIVKRSTDDREPQIVIPTLFAIV